MTLVEETRGCLKEISTRGNLEPLHEAAPAELRQLAEPLRVAIAGQLSAGKSTIVNSLVGRRVAATGRAETTEVNWWFRHGERERIEVSRPDGALAELSLDDASTLSTDDLDPDSLAAVTVFLDAPILREMIVIDTPGLFSPNEDRSERARSLLRARTARAAGAADALVYVTHEIPGGDRDVAELEAFRALLGTISKAPTNAVLLLSKVDRWWDRRGSDARDPLAIGRELLSHHEAELRTRVWDALPVVGLLAEAVLAGERPDADDQAALAAMAAYPHRRRLLLRQTDLLRAPIEGATPEHRRGLLDGLGTYGLARALEAADAGGDEAAIRAGLLADSGFDAARDLLDRTFRARGDLIRCDAALTRLERAALARPAGLDARAVDEARGLLDAVRLSEAAGQLRRLRALRSAGDPDLRITEEARAELRHLFDTSATAEAPGPEKARERWRYWRTVENAVPNTPERRWIAAEACRAYERLARSDSADS